MYCLENKVALVTGASRGIGRGIAISLAACGAKIAVNYASNQAEAENTVAEIIKAGGMAKAFRFDVAESAAVDLAVEAIHKEMGSIDILVNNAGIAVDGLLMRLKDDDFERQIATNLKGAFNCAKAVSRYMMKNRAGRIINITSVVGQSGNAGQTVYSAAKAGIIGFTKSLALELASRNILVNAVSPGFIETDMTKNLVEAGLEKMLAKIPLAKVGKVSDIANAVAFLASDQASYITGQVLAVNGGMYL
jgi:3-oxoacyl-[acyl-carrier protein] reductase